MRIQRLGIEPREGINLVDWLILDELSTANRPEDL
jgi:hypothetical protein